MTQRIANEVPMINPSLEFHSRAAEQLQGKLRGAAGRPQADSLREAAQEFEALFVAHLLKVMRETIDESGSDGGFGKGIYTELFDQEIARHVSRRGALGIREILVRRLSAEEPLDGAGKSPAAPGKPETGVSAGESEEIPDFRLPVQAPISSNFGLRKDPFTSDVRFHRGVDLAAPEGMRVRAALGGEVVFAGYEKGYGNSVVLRHPEGYETRYAHLKSIDVRVGDVLNDQQVLGVVGSTGRSTGAHLHFEVSRVGQRIDPKVALGD